MSQCTDVTTGYWHSARLLKSIKQTSEATINNKSKKNRGNNTKMLAVEIEPWTLHSSVHHLPLKTDFLIIIFTANINIYY